MILNRLMVFLVIVMCLFVPVQGWAENTAVDWNKELEFALNISHTVERERALRTIVRNADSDVAKEASVWLEELMILLGKKPSKS